MIQSNRWSKCIQICVPLFVLVLGCGPGVDSVGEKKRSINQEGESKSGFPGFSWVVAGELAVMPLPGGRRPLVEDVMFLHKEGILVLVSLTEEMPDSGVIGAAKMWQIHIPVQDFTAPTMAQIEEFVAIVKNSVGRDEPVGVHCTAGLGRSGTMAAAYLVATGLSAEEAITTLRQLRPGSIETELQEAAVKQYEIHFSKKR